MQALESYKDFLVKAQEQHEKTIATAQTQLQALIAQAAKAQAPAPTVPAAQSVWITGNDGEPFLLLNKPAADSIEKLLSTLQEVVQQLSKELTVKK